MNPKYFHYKLKMLVQISTFQPFNEEKYPFMNKVEIMTSNNLRDKEIIYIYAISRD